jgi:hypothetical protein
VPLPGARCTEGVSLGSGSGGRSGEEEKPGAPER